MSGPGRRSAIVDRWRRRVGRIDVAPSSVPHLACRAPSSSMFLDQRGLVRACCWNDLHVLGSVAERSLLDIWHGPAAVELRRAMADDDLTKGCEFCKWQVDRGHPELAASRWFTHFEPDRVDPDWPQQIEFAITNTCNLQCVMCNGEWSSSIRAQREHLPPLPTVYDDRFFDDLRAFLPHLRHAKFLGGEPLLATETLKVMDTMVDVGATARVHITTNGTQWTPRVERLLDLMPVDVAISLDAATADTYHRVRIGSSWTQVMANLDRFQRRARTNHTDLTLTFCLMTNNWQDFTAFCQLADRRGLGAAVNVVTQPDHLSLYHLPADRLASVVDGIGAQRSSLRRDLTRSRAVWEAEVTKLRGQVADRRQGEQVVGIDSHGP